MQEQWQRFMPLEQLMAQEANPTNPVIITACLSLADNLSEEWLQNFIHRILTHPRFSSCLVESSHGNFHFEPLKDFDCASAVQHHVAFEPTIDPSLSYSQRYAAFSERLSQIVSADLDKSRPLWKLFIFPGWSIVPDADPAKSASAVFRVHHSIADGVGLVKYFLSQLTDKPAHKPKKFLLEPARERHHRSHFKNIFCSSTPDLHGKSVLQMPDPGPLRRVYECFGDINSCVFRMFFPEPDNTLMRSDLSGKKVCALLPPSKFAVSMIRDASRVFGITINDLVYTALSGAVRQYLREHGDNPDELKGIRVGIPFNRHMFDEYKVSDISNQIALVALPLHVNVDSRLNRIRSCVATLRRMKRGLQPLVTSSLLGVLARVPKILRSRIWRHLTRASSILFTNVPGPREAVKIGGLDITSIHFFAPTGGRVGVTVGLFSYNGQLSIGVYGDQNRLNQPQRFLDLLAEEIDGLIQLSKDYS